MRQDLVSNLINHWILSNCSNFISQVSFVHSFNLLGRTDEFTIYLGLLKHHEHLERRRIVGCTDEDESIRTFDGQGSHGRESVRPARVEDIQTKVKAVAIELHRVHILHCWPIASVETPAHELTNQWRLTHSGPAHHHCLINEIVH